ncbi:MAG: BolA family transcriptional regulator [Candidatus Omnitrophica bacterium]|nr:BolA family transcriptional regulator [Candidatus Omnitrophota bacterium]
MTKAKIEKILQDTFHPQYLQVIDDSARHAGHAGAREGGHYRVIIVSSTFKGIKLIDRHRMVYESLQPIKNLIHALSIQAKDA